ncbi:FMN-binding protein [candidate division KSB1 bacterium]|nr:FMN-binding protein [candidate division KSB1 bacterium]
MKDDMLYQCHKRSVDVITGSTTNSKCLMKAVENALANRTQLK